MKKPLRGVRLKEDKSCTLEMAERISGWLLSNSEYPSVVLYEQSVSKHVADIVLVEKRSERNRIIVKEIKSPRDDFRRMADQCEDYLNWSDEVYVGVDRCNKDKAEKFISEFPQKGKIGLIIVTDEIKIDPVYVDYHSLAS